MRPRVGADGDTPCAQTREMVQGASIGVVQIQLKGCCAIHICDRAKSGAPV